MKKRLLSAALALAMVLTLIPATIVPAFAVEYGNISSDLPGSTIKSQTTVNGVTTTHYYYEAITNAQGQVTGYNTVNVQRFEGGNDGTHRIYGHWYWLNNKDPQAPVYHEVTSGIIAGNNGSGQWYPDQAAFTTSTTNVSTGVTTKALRSTTFTLLGNTSVSMTGFTTTNYWTSTSLNVDMEGTGTLTVPENLTSLTVTSKFQSTQTGTVAGLDSIDRSAYATAPNPTSGVTLNATNVKIASIGLTGRANNVTLNNCAIAGTITMNGNYRNTQTATADTWAGQTLTTSNNTTIGGAITINGDSNNVRIADTKAGVNTLSVTGAGTVSISGATTLGNVTATARGLNGAFPTVNVSGGTVGTITQPLVAGNKNSIIITVSNTNTQTGAISVERGTVNLTNGNVNGAVTVKAGALNATQDNVHVSGTLTLGDTDTTTLNLSATNSTYGGITVNNGKGSNLRITGWNAKRLVEGSGSNYGTVNLNDYTGNGITGGSFANAQTFENATKMKWLGPNVQFYVKNAKTSTTDLYNANEAARAISDITTDVAKTAGNIIVVGQTAASNIVLKNGQNTLAQIGYSASTGLIMPESINGMKIAQWYSPNNHNIILTSGVVQGIPLPATGTTLELNASGVTAEAKKITNATISAAAPVTNQNVRVALNGNNIALSGAVESGVGNISTIYVDLLTDAIDENGAPIKLEKVAIDYYPNTREIKFNMIQPAVNDAGGIISPDGAVLTLNNGTGEKYTVSANLAVSAPTLGLYMGAANKSPIVVTTGGKLSSWTGIERQALIDLIQKDGTFTIGNNRAVLEAINAAQATITSDNSVQSWITNAKNTIWRQGFKSTKPETTVNTGENGFAVSNGKSLTPNTGAFDTTTPEGAEIASLFAKAYIVPYLVVNITDYDRNGTMTATLTPYYRVDVSGAAYDPDFYYTVQPGRPMSALTGTMCPNGVVVDLGLPSSFDTQKMHQDGKYVYTGVSGAWTITHAGANGSLGSIEINGLVGPISMDGTLGDAIVSRTPTIAQLACTYDSLQAAIDDTVRGTIIQTDSNVTGILVTGETMDTIVIDGSYTGSCAITMTGMARKVKINAKGQQDVTATGANVAVDKLSTQVAAGYVYAVELKRDAVVAGTVVLAAQATNQGTVSLPVTSAKVGQTVTVTVVPNAGQTPKGVTVTTNNGTVVPATATGKINEYSFVVPQNTTSITVTPNFAGVTTADFVVSTNNYQGTAQVTAGTADGKAQQGSTVTVTTVPSSSSYRTMDLTARGNNGVTAAVSRTGMNTFNVTVPVGATTVTLTPNFDVNNGTPFTDVRASYWASSYIAWAYQNKYVEGRGTYTYDPSGYMYRSEVAAMLWKAAGKPSAAGLRNPYNDVPVNHWAYEAIVWCASQGLTDVSSGSFRPNAFASRAEVVSTLYTKAGKPNVSAYSGFADVSSSASYAKAVTWAKQLGLTNGYGGKTYFRPGYGVTRAEMATFLYRAFAKSIV
ncbi:MAG: S-layer homology domain-containing protein [Oscillospiraceae bacterium]|nr:S-layer homology domain-containing protein [Oscillospiraceae bacterium]